MVAAGDLRDAKTRAKAKWSGSGHGHVDALQRIDRVDGFEVSLTRTGEGDSTDGFEVSLTRTGEGDSTELESYN